MFQKFLASLGIGSVKVDTIITDPQVRVGEILHGEVRIHGGNVEQSISQIYLSLCTHYMQEINDTKVRKEVALTSLKVAGSLTIQPNEQKVIPFELKIPYETPNSTGKQKVYLRTGLDIANAVDPTDVDAIEVIPDPLAAVILEDANRLGFQHTYDSGVCVYKRFRGHTLPFVQEFELRPTRVFRGELDEIEFVFDVQPSGVTVLMQVDKRARGLMGFLEESVGADERYVRFQISRSQGFAPGQLEDLIRQVLRRG